MCPLPLLALISPLSPLTQSLSSLMTFPKPPPQWPVVVYRRNEWLRYDRWGYAALVNSIEGKEKKSWEPLN